MTPEEERERWPEHVRLRDHDHDLNNRRDAIEGFLEWLTEQGIVLAKLDKSGADYVPVEKRYSHLVAEHLGADMDAYISEENDMIQYAIDYFKNVHNR